MYRRPHPAFLDDVGTVSVEYAIVLFVGAVLAGVLLTIAEGEEIAKGFASLIDRALHVN
jgi:hypothetical protein